MKNLLSCIGNLFKAVKNGEKDEDLSLLEGKDSDTLKVILNTHNNGEETLLLVASVNKQRDIAKLLVEKLRIVQSSDPQQETIHHLDEVSAEECLPGPNHRKKRIAENECLSTWEDVDEFNDI